MKRYREIIYRGFGIGVVIALFCTYPVALIPPGITGLSYHIRIPWIFILSLVAGLVIFLSRPKFSNGFAGCVAVFGVSILYHMVVNAESIYACVSILGFVMIPLAAAVIAQHYELGPKSIGKIGFCLWALLIAYGMLNYIQGNEVIGITGNRNWMAISILALIPWALYFCYSTILTRLQSEPVRRALAIGLCVLPSLFLLNLCASRAAWLALIGYTVMRCVYNLRSTLARTALLIALGIGTIGVISFNSNTFVQAYVEDIRVPTWLSTGRLIRDNPWIGVGPGNFTKAHTPYRARSQYHRRRVATDLTTHPHNEFLAIAAAIGIPAAICWLLLQLPLVFNYRKQSLLTQCAQFSAFVIVFHAMLDKPLVQPPSNVIGLILTGFLWIPFIRYDQDDIAAHRNPWSRLCVLFLTGSFLLIAIDKATADVRAGWYRRQAATDEHEKRYESSFRNYVEATKVAPTDLKGFYGAGTIAVQYLLQPSLALPHLHRVEADDPNYAHLNRLLGKAYGTLNAQNLALRYFERECRLFPTDIAAFQNYFTCLYRNRKLRELADVYEYLGELYIERASAKLGTEPLKQLARSWYAAVQKNDPAAALSQAKALCDGLEIRFIDPLLTVVTKDHPLPPEYLFAGFRIDDYQHWRTTLTKGELMTRFAGKDTDLSVEQSPYMTTMTHLLRSVRIDTNDELVHLPETSWSQRSTNEEGLYSLVCWLSSSIDDLGPFIIPSSDDLRSRPGIVSHKNGTWRRCGIDDDNNPLSESYELPSILIDSNTLFADDEVPFPGRLFVHPHDFFLKNQVLFTLVNHGYPEARIPIVPPPTIQLHAISTALQKIGINASPEDLLYTAPFRVIADHSGRIEP